MKSEFKIQKVKVAPSVAEVCGIRTVVIRLQLLTDECFDRSAKEF